MKRVLYRYVLIVQRTHTTRWVVENVSAKMPCPHGIQQQCQLRFLLNATSSTARSRNKSLGCVLLTQRPLPHVLHVMGTDQIDGSYKKVPTSINNAPVWESFDSWNANAETAFLYPSFLVIFCRMISSRYHPRLGHWSPISDRWKLESPLAFTAAGSTLKEWFSPIRKWAWH